MRTSLLSILLLSFLHSLPIVAQSDMIRIDGPWRFSPHDDPSFARTDIADSGWAVIRAGLSWERQGFDNLDGHVWYRVRVVIPSALRERSSVKEGIRIFLGKVDDIDQTFLNGWMIGSNGTDVPPGVPPDTASMAPLGSRWDEERVYTLPYSDPRIRWDTENVVAVRVYDWGGPGGLWSGTRTIRAVKISDLVRIDHSSAGFRFAPGVISKTFDARNVSGHLSIEGMLTVRARDAMTGTDITHGEYPLTLKPGESWSGSFSIPTPTRSLVVEYRMSFTGHSDILFTQEEAPYVLTPPPASPPRINGPSVVGGRPGRPFSFLIPVSGARPLEFEAHGLPSGLAIDRRTGIVSGRLSKTGDHAVNVTAKNRFGGSTRTIMLKIGKKLALTPPMGWNSWNVWGLSVDQDKVVASARVFKDMGLADHGWSYINIDDGWEIVGDSPLPKRDAAGNIIVNNKFPRMKALGDILHFLGLKFGIYSSPGPLTCGGYTASFGYEKNDAQSYAAWGIDYLKYDWCSYGTIAKDHSRPELMKPYSLMRAKLDEVDRDIVYSLCQYGMGNVWEWGAEVGGDLWRTTGDITDTWESMSTIGFGQVANARFAGPGHWNDPDMLVVGWVGWGPNLHPTRLTPDEQYTHISLWCLLSAPLLIGCDLTRLDPFTLGLLTNYEVLAIDQDPLGKQATPAIVGDSTQVWTKELFDGTKAVGVFNLGSSPRSVQVRLAEIGLADSVQLRDVWRQKSLGRTTDRLSVTVPRHGVVLLKTER